MSVDGWAPVPSDGDPTHQGFDLTEANEKVEDKGSVGLRTYLEYFRSSIGPVGGILLFLGNISFAGAFILKGKCLAYWVSGTCPPVDYNATADGDFTPDHSHEYCYYIWVFFLIQAR